MQTRFSLTHGDFHHFQKLVARRIALRIGNYSLLGACQLGVWVLIGLAVASFFRLVEDHPDLAWPMRVFGVFAGLALLAVMLMPYLQQALIRKHLLMAQGSFLAEQTVTLSEVMLRIDASRGSAEVLWSGFLDAAQDERNYYFFLDTAQAVIIPKAEATGEFKALLERQLQAIGQQAESGG